MKKYLAIILIFSVGLLAGVCIRHQDRLAIALGLAPVSGGDVNGDGQVNITDAVFLLNFLFIGGRTPLCMESADANNDGEVEISDGILILKFLGVSICPYAFHYCTKTV